MGHDESLGCTSDQGSEDIGWEDTNSARAAASDHKHADRAASDVEGQYVDLLVGEPSEYISEGGYRVERGDDLPWHVDSGGVSDELYGLAGYLHGPYLYEGEGEGMKVGRGSLSLGVTLGSLYP